MGNWRAWSVLGTVVVLSGCAAPAAPPPSTSGTGATEAGPPKTLIVATRAEPPSLARRPLRPLGLTPDLSPRMFNADLTIRNDNGLPVAYLSEAVPQLNTETWKVNPDGTMDTTYHLKPNTIWHDGQPLTSDDFVFSIQVYKKPELGLADTVPLSLISSVTTPDARTVIIHWKQTYPDADGGGGGSAGQDASILPPLPRLRFVGGIAYSSFTSRFGTVYGEVR